MKAIVYHKYGSINTLALKEIEKPIPKDDEILIKVYATSINSWDWDLLRGKPFIVRVAGGGILKPRKKILGCDIAGRIETVGKNVLNFKPGDEVFGDISQCGWGGFAEYVCAKQNTLSLKPSNLTFEDAAAIPQAAVMALQSLYDKVNIKPGDKILMNGAGGGVGTFAIQIAKSLGAEVTAVDSAIKFDMLRLLGADHTIDYTKENFTKTGERYDLIIDVIGNQSIFDYKRALNHNGCYAMVGGSTSLIFQLLFLGSFISLFGNKKIGILAHQPNKYLDKLLTLYNSGKIKPVIDRKYTLPQVPEALEYFGKGLVKGKIVISIPQKLSKTE